MSSPSGETGDFVGDAGLFEDEPQVGVAGMRIGDEQVVPDGAMQHWRVLFQKPEPAAQFSQWEAADVVAFPAHRPGAGIVEAAQQRQNGRLSGARRPDQRGDLISAEREGDVIEDGDVTVGERHMVELDQRRGVLARPGGPDSRLCRRSNADVVGTGEWWRIVFR